MSFDSKNQQVYLSGKFEQRIWSGDKSVTYESNCLDILSFKSPYGSMQRDSLRIFEVHLL